MSTPPVTIRRLSGDPDTVAALVGLLVEVVEAGASVSFMAPLSPDKAVAFWRGSFDAAERGGKVVLGAYLDQTLVGTVTLNVEMPENQPHRADVAKLLVAPAHRRQGFAERLLEALDDEARALGRRVLVLDTVVGEAGDRLYARVGWTRVGEIPDYALMPDGRLCATAVYWKSL